MDRINGNEYVIFKNNSYNRVGFLKINEKMETIDRTKKKWRKTIIVKISGWILIIKFSISKK